jgi:hypothetical protein
MTRHSFAELAVGCALGLALAASAFAQYGGGGGGMGGGMSGAGVYTPPKGGYKTSTGIAIGGAAAAGVGITYLALRNHATVVGCVQQSSEGSKLMNEKDKNTYALLASNDVVLSPGERVALKGKKEKDDTGKPTFRAKKLVKDYGPCK